MSERPHVVVVGGGISGLTAAHQIRRVAGEAVRITILDQAPTVGGKLVSGELDGCPGRPGRRVGPCPAARGREPDGTRRAGGRPRAPRHDRRPAVDPWTAAAPAAGAADGDPHRPSRARRLGDPLVVGTRPCSPGLGAPGLVGRRRSCARPVRRLPAGSRGRGPARGAAPGRGLCGPRRRPVPRCGPAAARGGGSRGAIVAARSATGERCRAVGRPGLRWSSWRPGTTARRGRRGLRGDGADPADRPSDRAGARGLAHRHGVDPVTALPPGRRGRPRGARRSCRSAAPGPGAGGGRRSARRPLCVGGPGHPPHRTGGRSFASRGDRFPRASCGRQAGQGLDLLLAEVGLGGDRAARRPRDPCLGRPLRRRRGAPPRRPRPGRSRPGRARARARLGPARPTRREHRDPVGGALPQYLVGHLERVARVRSSLHAYPSLALCGAAYDGVGVPACIASGEAAAAQVLRALETRRQWGHGNRGAGERAGAVGDSA